MPPPRATVPRPWLVAAVAALLGLHVALAISSTFQLGFTADETAHLTSGYVYWRHGDYRLQPENGNLPQRWGALPLLFAQPRLDAADQPDAWRRSHVWLVSQDFLFESGNETDFLLLCSRTAMVLWSVATAVLVFAWSRHRWGDYGGLLSLALFAFSPTTLAHGPLVTSDMCATFCLLACAGAWWWLAQKPDATRLALSLTAAGLAAVAKFSCVLLLPVAFLIAVVRLLQPEPLVFGRAGGPWIIGSRLGRATALLALGALHVLAAAGVVWLCFGFRYSAFAPDLPAAFKFFAAWEKIIPVAGFWHEFFSGMRTWHVLPEAYLQGFAFVLWAADERGAFAAGQFSTTGWWWFFPYAFLVKSTVTELVAGVAVLALAAGAIVRRSVRLRLPWRDPLVPLGVFALVYGAASLTSHLNIGHRHMLPLYPVLFIAAGSLTTALRGKRTLWAAVLVLGAAIEAWSIRPHFLAYFNPFSGGPAQGWRHLVDSSLDWGQNSPRLADWLRTHRRTDEPVYVSLFGSDDPFYHGVRGQELSSNFSFGRKRQWIELKPGLYCVSASMLQDVYSPYAGAWTLDHEVRYQKLLRGLRAELAAGTRSPALGEFGLGPEHLMWNLDRARFARLCLYLRVRPPEAVIGYTIFVHRLSAEEVRIAVDGSMSELAAAMAAAALRGVRAADAATR